jgi:2OG-Fe(II) oxygenase superfamily
MIELTARSSSPTPLSASALGASRLLDLGRAHFRYEPYPIGIIRDIFEPSLYARLVDTFPQADLFRFMGHHGDKWSLSEVNNPDSYYKFLRSNPDWNRLFAEVKSKDFIDQVLHALAQSKINLGLHPPTGDGWLRRRWDVVLGRKSFARLRARFEFSMMSAEGGHILPHTDSPQKHITLVVSMVRPGEWDKTWGGGTDLMRPLDPSENFNLLNRYLQFDQVETIGTMDYEPNQCVIFIKTFNSLHAVKPMSGPRAVMRRTLTINIESA